MKELDKAIFHEYFYKEVSKEIEELGYSVKNTHGTEIIEHFVSTATGKRINDVVAFTPEKKDGKFLYECLVDLRKIKKVK